LSYDLYFWSYIDEGTYPPGKEEEFAQHCVALAEGSPRKEIALLPVEQMKAKVAEALEAAPDWTHDEGPFWLKGGAGVIEVYVSEFYARFSLRGAWDGDDANRLNDVMKPFACPLFDPQTGERFAL